jgi:acetylornithine deacetylase
LPDRRPTDRTAGQAPDPRTLLANLVAFDTTSAKTNIPMIEFIEAFLAERGIASTRVPTADGLKSSLFATIGDVNAPGGIGLSGHTDVVPVTGQDWSSDPFTLTERDGRLYGRGTCDMKGYLACMLAAVPLFQARSLSVPIHFLFSYDEEVGCIGVKPMVNLLGVTLPKPALVIVGEPTTMGVVDAHKGAARFRTTVTGREAHSSMPHIGVNAIHMAGLCVGELSRLEENLRAAERNTRFNPAYSTLQIGLIEGGRAQNIVPRHCSFTWEIRSLPGFDSGPLEQQFQDFVDQRCLPMMQAIGTDTGIETVTMNRVPAFFSGESSEAVLLAQSLAGSNERLAVSYGTEAGHFQSAGCASVICGPGDIAQAHRPDEFILPSELDRCMGFMAKLAERLAA